MIIIILLVISLTYILITVENVLKNTCKGYIHGKSYMVRIP